MRSSFPVTFGGCLTVVLRLPGRYVTRTQEVVLGGVELGGAYKDAYLEAKRPRSVLCMPIVRHGGERAHTLACGPAEKHVLAVDLAKSCCH